MGIDAVGLMALPLILVLFIFAVWFGATQAAEGIDAEEAARRQAEVAARKAGSPR